ncbi:acyl carrier protein [Actinomadura sp. ATCC 39365]|uniref:acyl carrier protein n=1 Tax=Nonomuraea sp. NPDC005692 TaxID=3157168 RepID=UPI0033D4DB0A
MRDTVKSFLRERGAAPELRDDDDLFDVGGLSSMAALQIVAWIEDTFDIVIKAADLHLGNFRTIDAICSYIERHTPSLSGTGGEAE